MYDYINLKEVQSSIEIKFRIVYNKFHKLGFEYKNVKKDVFIGKYKCPDIVEEYKKFLTILKYLESYLIEFEKDKSMRDQKISR